MLKDAAPHTTVTEKHPEQGIESFTEHLEYAVNVAGIDHVGFGPDTSHGDHFGLHRVFSAVLSIAQAFHTTASEVPYVKGAENPVETSWNVVRWLVKHGYSDEDIAKIIGGNAIRVLREIWY